MGYKALVASRCARVLRSAQNLINKIHETLITYSNRKPIEYVMCVHTHTHTHTKAHVHTRTHTRACTVRRQLSTVRLANHTKFMRFCSFFRINCHIKLYYYHRAGPCKYTGCSPHEPVPIFRPTRNVLASTNTRIPNSRSPEKHARTILDESHIKGKIGSTKSVAGARARARWWRKTNGEGAIPNVQEKLSH